MRQWLLPLIVLLAFAGTVATLSPSSSVLEERHSEEGPQVKPQEEAHSAVNDQHHSEDFSKNFVLTLSITTGSAGKHDSANNGEHGSEEGTEFWPSFLGYRLKITDSLLVVFTLALALFTYRLWKSTHNLWRSAENQLQEFRRSLGHSETVAAQQTADTKESIKAAQRSADAAQGSLRPWVIAEFKVVHLSRDSSGVHIGMHITTRNLGRSPAQYVFVSPRVVFDDYEASLTTQREVCENCRSSWDNIKRSENILFPDRPRLTNGTGVVRNEEIIATQEKRIKLAGQARVMGAAELEAMRRTGAFAVVGCVCYGFAGSPDIHQTGFILVLSTSPEAPGGVPVPALIDLAKEGSHSLAQPLYLVEAAYGSFAT